jgi:hypothetical protein
MSDMPPRGQWSGLTLWPQGLLLVWVRGSSLMNSSTSKRQESPSALCLKETQGKSPERSPDVLVITQPQPGLPS